MVVMVGVNGHKVGTSVGTKGRVVRMVEMVLVPMVAIVSIGQNGHYVGANW